MFRSDRDALAQQVDDLRREREDLRAQNEAMRSDLLTRRQVAPRAPGRGNVYKQGVAQLTPGERAALTQHSLERFPIWAVLLLHFVTLGVFPLIHFSLLHDRLPRAESDDPSAPRAIGFSFIPYFNLYWIVFNTLRLTDRLNLQFRLRGMPDRVPRGLLLLASVVTLIPYVDIVFAGLFFWPIAIYYLQRSANELAELPPGAAGVATADEAAAAAAPWAPGPRVRVPRVEDLPGPDDVVQQQAEAEAGADEAERARRTTR
jgi:hypothetical protein